MAFFPQLKLLLWKNGLNIIRKPVWSLTLIIWPVVIFIIIAVTRSHFPPLLRDTCYVEPRNLPSTGFFPFLQTLMCNTDSNCHNASRLVNPSTFTKRSTTDARSTASLRSSLLAKMLEGGDFYNFTFSNDPNKDPVLLTEALDKLWALTYQPNQRNTSVIHARNTTLTSNEEALNQTMESMKLLKQGICSIIMAVINRTSTSPYSNELVTFCTSDNPVCEDLLLSINQILKEELLTNPDELAKVVGTVIFVFQELQNQSSLWETLLAFPQLFSGGSLDEMLDITEVFLTNVQESMKVIQTNFPETAEMVSAVHPFIAGAINIIHYVQKWPGKDVYLSLGDVVKLHNNSFDYLIELVLQNVQLPLVQAMALTFDRDIVHSYICDGSNNPSWLTTACVTGIVDMVLHYVSPNKLAQQVVLAWSKHVAPHDVTFAKGLLHSLMGDGPPGPVKGFNVSRTRRNIETQTQNIEEELFLTVGQVVLEISEIDPDLEMIVQSIVSVGFQSMRITSLSLDIVGDVMHNILTDIIQLQNIYLTLLTNQTKASLWMDGVRHSVLEVTMKSLTSESLTCEEVLDPFQWLLSTETIKFEMWKAIICEDTDTLEDLLLMDWMPLVEKAYELYSTFTEVGEYHNVTLPMVLYEWHKLHASTLEFGAFLDRLSSDLDEGYWLDWIPGNMSTDIVETLQQSVFVFMVNLGEKMEASPLWPELKSYFHMIYWVFNYTPGVTTQPANCSFDIETLNIDCDTGLDWYKFVHGFMGPLMLPNQNTLVKYLKGTVSLLQTVFGDLIMDLTGSYLTQEIKGGDALSAYLINLMKNLHYLVSNISALSNQNISNSDVMVPLISNLLESTGLSPLLPFLFSNNAVKVSDIIDAAVKLGRSNQDIFNFNETDPTMPELERLIMKFLSLESNLTMSLSYILGNTLLTYNSYFDPYVVAYIRESLKPFTSQTSSGVVETILTALELLKEAVDSPNDDPATVILSYIRQLQEFGVSLFQLRRIQNTVSPDGQLSTAQITDLSQVSTDFLNLLTPESLHNLTQIGPDAAQELVIQKFLAFLPPEFQEEAALFFQDFKSLQYHLSLCAERQNCSAGISEVFTFLDQISNLMLSANGNVTVNMALTNKFLEGGEYEDIAFAFFSLFLSPRDTSYVGVFKQILNFIRVVIKTPNITVSHIQNALRQSNVTLEELNYITHLTGSANINELLINIMGIADVPKCFEVQHNTSVTAQCIKGLIDKVSNFLKTIPALQDHTDIIGLIPLIVNETTTDVIQAHFSSNAHMDVIHVLNNTLNNIKINLQLNNLNTPEIMNEIRVIEGLLKVVANPEPVNHILNAMSVPYSEEVTRIYLQVMQWYLQRLENVTSSSFVSDLLYPLFRLTQLQVTLQLAQTNLTIFINNQTVHFVYPTDGAEVRKIGQATVAILQQIVKYTIVTIQLQNENAEIFGSVPLFNTTELHRLEQQIHIYLDVIQIWMKEPNVTEFFTGMLQWGNSTLNVSTPLKDLHFLLQTLVNYLSEDQLAYLTIITNITKSLNKAIMVLEQPGDIQFDHLYTAIMEAVQTLMKIITQTTDPLPHSVQQDIKGIVHDTLAISVQTDLSYATSLNLTLQIMKRAENIVKHLVPDEFAVYLLSGLKVGTTYFETIASTSGPDNWNHIILNQMKTVQSLLPPNSTAQYYVSVLINITHIILESGQGNSSFANETIEIITEILGQIWQIITHDPGTPSLGVFTDFAAVLEEIFTGKADGATWNKLEKMLKLLLSPLSQMEIWDDVTSVVPYYEKTVAFMVNTTNAENMLIRNLQKPLMTLMTEIAQFVNSSHFNLSEISERMQPAIENTLLAAEQANGTLECSEALKAWEPVGAAAGLNQSVLEMWCDISLQPVLEAYAAYHYIYPHFNTSDANVTEMAAGTAASRIVKATRSLYQVKRNQSHAMEQVIMALYNQLIELLGQPPSPSGELFLFKQLQDMQLRNSLSSIQMLSDELHKVAPMLWSCVDSMDRALYHSLNNSHHLQDSDTSHAIFTEAAIILLSCANITSEEVLSLIEGDLSWLIKGPRSAMRRNALQTFIHMTVSGNDSMVYEVLEQIMASDAAMLLIQKVVEMSEWLASTEAYGLELLTEALPKISELLKHLLSMLTQIGVDLPESTELVEDLAENIIAMLRQLLNSGLFTFMDHHQGEDIGDRGTTFRHKREAPILPQRGLVDDFSDLLYIDYPAMFRAISAPLTPEEIMETAHVFFANPDLNIVVKGTTNDMPWVRNGSWENTIDAALGILSYATLPNSSLMSYLDVLRDAVALLPDSLPFISVLQNITRVLASESQENLDHFQETFQTAELLFQTDIRDPLFTELLDLLTSQVCIVEDTASLRYLLEVISLEPGQLCHIVLPGLKTLLEGLLVNTTDLNDALFQTIIGDPSTFDQRTDWSVALSESLGFNTSSLSSLGINITSPGKTTVGELLHNQSAFVQDVQQHMDFDPATLNMFMETIMPTNNLKILSWLVNLRHCNYPGHLSIVETDLFKTFCSMSVQEWYNFTVLLTRHLNLQKFIYRMVLSDELQSLLGLMFQMAQNIIHLMEKFLPAIDQLQDYMLSMESLNLVADNEFNQVARGVKPSLSVRATFVTISRAMCSRGVMALFGLATLPIHVDSNPSFLDRQKREEMIDRFKIPQNATPFCMNMYLDMVSTRGGAIAWAFLKPMLMGKILFSPNTPSIRAVMEKANGTLQEFANLKKHSDEWIHSSGYLMESAKILSRTLPMLKSSLSNPFVQNFIQMQTDIDVHKMRNTLNGFSNMTLMLEKNKHIMDQITLLSTLLVNMSSCIKFDRYQGYDSVEELDANAQELAKDRNLYGSVIFTLPKDDDSLPPNVSYTIRMHMDNVMRTDRIREPYFVKDTHISAQKTMRYNRGFVYLQENIDRAIIEIQTGQRVTDTAVQLQPFPYPCYLRDEYLEAISFVFPIMLMLAWVLFVADFVKKLVHEKELRLHEYMKMMGVNPLSHFFAWFLECAAHLMVTIIILTLVLKYGGILSHSDGFLLFLYLSDYGLSILAFSFLLSSFFDKTYVAALSGSLLYILCFFPYIVVMAMETSLTLFQKSALSILSPSCFSYASQYISRYESQGEGIHWYNSYSSPIAGDTASFGWLCWLMLLDSIYYFILGAYIRMVFPGAYGIPAPWYFPFTASFWADLWCCIKKPQKGSRGLLFTNIMTKNPPVFDDKGKGQTMLSTQAGDDFSHLPVGVALHGLTKIYGDRVAIQNLNVSFHEGHVTSLLGHNGAGKTTTMSLLTGLFAPSSGTIEVYGRDMQTHLDDVRKDLGVCMQYDVLFDHMTTEEHLLLYGQIKAPHWSHRELQEQVRTILEETGMYAQRHKRVGTLSGGMKRKLSISIAFIGDSRLVVLDEPTTGVDPCSRRSIWDIVIQHKKRHTIIMSTHHLDEAEVLSDRIAFLERGGLKCCGSPVYLKEKLGQGYKLTLNKKMKTPESERFDDGDMKAFIQAHIPEARLKEAHGSDQVYTLPPFTSSNASSYRSLLIALDANLDDLQLGGYGISDTTLEEVFLQLTDGNEQKGVPEDRPFSISETVSDSESINSFPADTSESIPGFSDKIHLTSSSKAQGISLAWQQIKAILIKRFHHSRRDYKGLISQILLPVLFVVFAMGLGSIKNDLRHYPKLELSPALYNMEPSYSFFSKHNEMSSPLADKMMSYPGLDNSCLDESGNPVCMKQTSSWESKGKSSEQFSDCKCSLQEQSCHGERFDPPSRQTPSSQIVYNLSGINVENYLMVTANDFIRNRYGGFEFGMRLPSDLQMDLIAKSTNATLSKVWFNPEGHHSMPAYLNSLNNLILRAKLPEDKEPQKYAISVSSHPYFGRADNEDSIIQGMLQILVAVCVLTGYSITTASFAVYAVTEHHNGSKRLQHIAGISEPFYWAVTFLYDMMIYMVPVILTVAVVAAFQIPAFTERQNLAAVTLLLVLFGFATFPWMYLLSGVFKDAEMAFITYVCINLFISTNTIMSSSILYFLSQVSTQNEENIKETFRILSRAFLIFPQFNFGNGLMQLARMNIEVQLMSGYGIDAYKNPFSMDALGWMIVSSIIQGVVFFTLRLLLNRFLIRKVRRLFLGRKNVSQVIEDEDEDVAAEHMRVVSGAASSDILQVNQLTKIYQHLNKKICAVKRLSVGIPAGECFGLLGVNGAGKTTTFKMLTGDVSPTDGTAQIRDWDGRLVDIMECRQQGINIGYCPQVDALDNLLTGEEHLYFYARIQGISKSEIDGVVRYLLKKLELNYHQNVTTDGYSCGTRRKLSTAIALIGHPQILLLDEPSSGMDPRTKRHLWKIISEEVKGKSAVVLTSHSMEECEALCSRLAIMVKGQFRCLGSLQHIKNRFGSGFTVKMYLAEAGGDVEAITGFMQRQFPSTYLKDQHSSMVEYHVPVAPGGVAAIFDKLECKKSSLQIKHFSVSQTTLDEVFINFAMGSSRMESTAAHVDLDSIKDVEA
uniref:glucosylceramide transporter ABCA12 n=1 Tax=Doryrhamphus excisus TaxID=161450 RepID=UPI0025ADA08F|nr:glucosylceramide transporter ABCA12 [Doryrhamphus excisus]